MYVRLLEELLALCTSSTFMDIQLLLSRSFLPPVFHSTIKGYKPLHTYEDSSSRKKTATGVGTGVGNAVGCAVGSSVGSAVGSSVGNAVGSSVGNAVGSTVGCSVGSAVGSSVGTDDGLHVKITFPELPVNMLEVDTPERSQPQIV